MVGAGDFSFLEMYTIPPQASGSSSWVLLGSSVVNFPKSDFAADGGGSKMFYP